MSDMVIKITLDAEALKSGLNEINARLKSVGDGKLSIDASAAEGSVKSVTAALEQSQGSLKGWWKAHQDTISSLSLAYRGVMDVFRDVQRGVTALLKPAQEAEAAQAGLAAALRNTGVYSDDLQKSLTDNSAALQKLTIYEDDAITAGTALMQNIGHLGAAQLPEAQKAAIGLASAFKIDLNTAFELVGKAAVGSTSTLARYGIVLDENLSAQEKFNAVLELGAGKFSLAEAEAQTSLGAIEQFKNTWGDMMETIGNLLLPVISDLLKTLKPVVEWFGNLNGVTKAALVLTPLATAAWVKFAASQVAATVASGGLTAGLTAASVAVKAFLASIPGIGWAILGVGTAVGVLSALLGKASKDTKELSDSQKTLAEAEEIASQGAEKLRDSQERNKKESKESLSTFDMLIGKLEVLRNHSTRTAESKRELKGIVSELNSNYGQFIGNINLETSAWQEVERALYNARQQLISYYIAKQTKENFETMIQTYTSGLSKLRDYYKQQGMDLDIYANRTDPWPKIYQTGPVPEGPGGQERYKNKQAELNVANYYIDQLNLLKVRIETEMPEYKEALGKLFDLGGTPLGGSGGGGTSGAADNAKAEFERLLQELDDYQKTELEKIQAAYLKKEAVIKANTAAESQERQDAIKKLDAWKIGEEKKFTDKMDADRKAATEAYYEEVKFIDAGYYEWKKVKIQEDVDKQGLGTEQAKLLTQQRLAELKKEKAAWERLPLDALIEKYQDLKSEISGSADQSAEVWGKARQALIDVREQLEAFSGLPGVAKVLEELQDQIEEATTKSQKSKRNWFWSGILGFDPDSAQDKAKIESVKSIFKDIQGSVATVISDMVQQNQQRKEAELARIDEVAAQEKWSGNETLAAKAKVNAKFAAEERKLKNLQKAMSIASATMNTAESVTKALTLGFPLGPIMAAIIGAMGAVQIKLIAAQKFASGGLFRGRGGPRDDQNLIYVSDGEYIVNAQSAKRYKHVLDALNFGLNQRVYPHLAFAGGGMVMGGMDLGHIARKIDAVNMNLSRLDLAVNVINNAPDINTRVEKHEIAKARLTKRGKAFQYGV